MGRDIEVLVVVARIDSVTPRFNSSVPVRKDKRHVISRASDDNNRSDKISVFVVVALSEVVLRGELFNAIRNVDIAR